MRQPEVSKRASQCVCSLSADKRLFNLPQTSQVLDISLSNRVQHTGLMLC
jgi:hypothetical protein